MISFTESPHILFVRNTIIVRYSEKTVFTKEFLKISLKKKKILFIHLRERERA